MSLVKPVGENNPHPQLVKAAELLAQARAIQEEFSDDPSKMPADVAHTQNQLIRRAKTLEERVRAEHELKEAEDWLREPQYKADPRDVEGNNGAAKSMGHGMPLLEAERKERQTKAFWDAIRKGRENLSSEVKADLVLDEDGQLLVPQELVGAIIKELPRAAVLRPLAFVRPTTSNKVDITDLTEGDIGWNKLEIAPEGGASDATPSPDENSIHVHDLIGLVKFGRDLLEDEDANLEPVTRELVTARFAEEEDDAFANGAGGTGKNGQPLGIARADFTGRTVTATGTAVGDVTAEDVKSLKYRVSARMRRSGVYLANSAVEERVALMRDSGDTGSFLWQPSVSTDEPASFSGKRWYTLDGLPEPGADATASLVFGDVRSGYMIADRRRMTVQRLNERFALEGKVGLLFSHRVGGGIIRDNAFAALVFPSS